MLKVEGLMLNDGRMGFGTIEHTLPTEVRAGERTGWSLSVRFAEDKPAGTRIGVARHWPSDWGRLQWEDPWAANYVEAASAGGVRIQLKTMRYEPWHPFDHVLMVELLDPLKADTALSLSFGAGMSPGVEVQTFVEERCPLSVRLFDAAGSGWNEIGRVSTRVVGSAPLKLVATAPSIVGINEPFSVHVRMEDRWGNPASDVDIGVEIEGLGVDGVLSSAQGSWVRLDAVLKEPGIHRLSVVDRARRFSAVSNPIRCARNVGARLFWGDLHAQSAIGCGAQGIESYFRFARDFAASDFAGHQGNCFLISNPEWEESQEVTKRLYADGRFVPLLGYEWSGATPVGGDRNIYFPGDTAELRRCSHRHVPDHSDIATDLPHIEDVHAQHRDKDVLMAVHVGGRTTNLQWHEPSTERLLEVHSTHATSEWFLFEALRRGYRFGVTGGSDGVDGRPGASHPGRMSVRNLRGGLAAVAAPELSRKSLWDSFCAKRTYATTGARMLLSFAADNHSPGEGYQTKSPPRLTFEIEGTAPLRAIDIFRGTECIVSIPVVPRDAAPSGWLRISWSGASGPGNWQRARMIWDGHIDITAGTILAAEDDWRDTMAEGMACWSTKRVEFTSITAGNWNSVKLKLDETSETVLRVVTSPLSAEFPLCDVAMKPLERSASDPARAVRVERLPLLPAALGQSGEFVDLEAPAGEHAYWIRVTQEDGSRAWSTPVFAEVRR